MNNNTRALKSGVWYTVSNFLVRATGFITTPIFTRLLTKAEFGEYNNYSSWLSILTIFVTLNLESSLISAKYDYKDSFDNYIFSVLSLSSLSTIIWILGVNIFSNWVSSFLEMDLIYINCLLVYLFFHIAVNFFQIRERYLFRYKATVVTSMLLSIGTSALSVFMVILMTNKLRGRILGSIIPTIILGIPMYLFFMKKGGKIDISCWKYAMKICLPYIPHLLSLTFLNSIDRVMIRQIRGAEETALYSLAYTCGSIITLLITSMNNAFAPWLGDRLYNKDYTVIRNFSKKYVMIFSYFAVGLMLITPEILLILGGKEYYSAIYVMPPVTMGCICQFIYTMFVNVEQFSKKTMGMALGSVTAALLNYILNMLFIPRYGYIAAAYTTLIGFLWLLVFHMIIVHRLHMNKIYDYSFIIILVIILNIVTVLVNILYTYPDVRFITTIIYIILGIATLYKYRGEILTLIKNVKAGNA